MYANNQIFEQAAFQRFCRDFERERQWELCDPAIFTQLAVLPNKWFGVSSAREVTVVWYYLGSVTTWAELFASNAPVRAIIEAERSTNGFPNYSTLDTNLSATQINLLANLAAWSVNEAERAQAFSQLFRATN